MQRDDQPERSPRTLRLGGTPVVTFEDLETPLGRYVAAEYGAILSPDDGAAVRIVSTPGGDAGPRTRFRVQNIRVAATPDGRYFLCDENGAEAQLPADGDEHELTVDPRFKANWGQTYTHRLIEWQATRHAMVIIYGAGAVLPEGAVVVAGFRGVGKSAIALALVQQGSAYLGQDRIVLAGGGTVTSLPVPIQLFLSRPYDIPHVSAARALSRAELRRVQWLPWLAAHTRGRVRGRLERELQPRFVPFDVQRGFSHVTFPDRTPLDSIVFLVPTDDAAVDLRPIDERELLVRAAQSAKYLHDAFISPFECMFSSAFPSKPTWPVSPLATTLERLPDALRGVRGWVLRARPYTDPRVLAEAARTTLTSEPG